MHCTQEICWPPLWHHAVSKKTSSMPHLRYHCGKSAFPLLHDTSKWYLVSIMYSYYPWGCNANHSGSDSFAIGVLAMQALNSTWALGLSISLHHGRFVLVFFKTHVLAFSILHHRWPKCIGQNQIGHVQKPLQRRRDCCLVLIQVKWWANFSIWHSIQYPHDSETPLCVR